MPGCCVPTCKNSAAKGYIMKHFPRNPEIRAQWAVNIPRANWIPTDSSCICEIHFPPEMWEKPRIDGKRILKHHAVPTIFEPCSTTVASRQNTAIKQSVDQTVEMGENLNLANNDITALLQEEPTESSIVEVTENKPYPFSPHLHDKINWKKKYEELNDLVKQREKTYDAVVRKYNTFKAKVKRLNAKNRSRPERCVNPKLHSIIAKVFTNDQIEALTKKSTRGLKWSEETLKKAIRLKVACGVSGYKELLKHIPLPSVRTLQEKLATLHFEPGICEEILNILKGKVNNFEDDRDKDTMIALDVWDPEPEETRKSEREEKKDSDSNQARTRSMADV